MTGEPPYRGRLAPSPSGRLHLGVARTALITWLCARKAGGQLVFRMEDLDGPRVVQGAAEAIADELRFLGLDWDEGYQCGGDRGPYQQSQRGAFYERALQTLRERGLLFACSCSRKDVAEASRAPHGELGPVYPGTCRRRPTRPERSTSMRFAMPQQAQPFVDGLFGPQDLSVRDDFVVQRADGLYAYQLAVVVDDIAMGITEVVRGADLLAATPRQLALYEALGAAPPRFLHVPLLLGLDRKRLAKRHGSVSVTELRAQGASAEQILGGLSASLGLNPQGSPCTAAELLSDFDPTRLPTEPSVLDPGSLLR